MHQSHLWPEKLVETDDLITISVTIELANGTRNLLWYRLPLQYRNCLTISCDSFVIATIFLWMSQGVDVLVHGEVSPSLLRNLEEFQAVWSSWKPQNYQRIEIKVEREKEQAPAKSKELALATFSGGVDSCFTVFRHHQGLCGRQKRELKAGLMVHGFDIPLEDLAFSQAVAKSKILLESLNMQCIPMATNFRQVIKLDWEDTFGTAIASCLHIFKGGYTTGVIASSHAYQTLNFIYGSNPFTDSLLSSKYFEIVHDGALFARLEKMQVIIDWPEALENLRVCWQGSEKSRNCGCCEKCIRNILNFRILGVALPPCFEKDVSNQQIIMTKIRGTSLEIWQTLLAKAKAKNISDSWVKSVAITIRKNQFLALIESYLPSQLKAYLKLLQLLFKHK